MLDGTIEESNKLEPANIEKNANRITSSEVALSPNYKNSEKQKKANMMNFHTSLQIDINNDDGETSNLNNEVD
jgi:hypothetical protein